MLAVTKPWTISHSHLLSKNSLGTMFYPEQH